MLFSPDTSDGLTDGAAPRRQLWQPPYGLAESAVLTVMLMATGFALQWFAGPVNFYLLTFPFNAAAGLIILILGGLLAAFRRAPVCAWLTGPQFAAALLAGILVLTLVMGIVPQTDPEKAAGISGRLGFSSVTHCWPFVLLFTLLLVTLAGVSLRRLRHPGKNAVFLLWHFGVFTALAGAGLGIPDQQHYVMYVNTGQTQWRVFSADEQFLDLPVAITLHSFTMEEYDPKLVIIDRKTGLPQPAGNPEFFQIAPQTPDGRLGSWNIHIDTYYPRAVFAGNETFQPQEKPGASPAVKVTVTPAAGGKALSGWVSAGNMDEFMHAVNLDEGHALAVTPPEPKQFISDVTVLVQGGTPVRTKIEVNNPLRIGSWIIYQYGYDARVGRYSDYSSFELVCDPWLPVVYAGFVLMALAAVCGICRRPVRREVKS